MATDSGTPEAKMTVYYQREGFQIPSPSEVEACEPIDPDNKPNVLRFSPTIVVKRGCNLRPRFSEAKSLRFIADNTSLPVPKLHAAYTWGPLPADIDFPDGYYDSYMFVDYVPGVTLRSIWSKSTDEFKAVLKSELKDCLEKLRALPAPPNYIGTVENEGIWINYLGEYIQGHSKYQPPYFGATRLLSRLTWTIYRHVADRARFQRAPSGSLYEKLRLAAVYPGAAACISQ